MNFNIEDILKELGKKGVDSGKSDFSKLQDLVDKLKEKEVNSGRSEMDTEEFWQTEEARLMIDRATLAPFREGNPLSLMIVAAGILEEDDDDPTVPKGLNIFRKKAAARLQDMCASYLADKAILKGEGINIEGLFGKN